MLTRIDALYRARAGVVDIVEVPKLGYLVVDGRGDPNGSEFAAATRALYTASYGAHFLIKKRLGRAPKVPPLEALWWVDDADQRDMPRFVSHRRRAGRRSLPVARTGWASESGEFTELHLFGGWSGPHRRTSRCRLRTTVWCCGCSPNAATTWPRNAPGRRTDCMHCCVISSPAAPSAISPPTRQQRCCVGCAQRPPLADSASSCVGS
jgi:hypothetical protein